MGRAICANESLLAIAATPFAAEHDLVWQMELKHLPADAMGDWGLGKGLVLRWYVSGCCSHEYY